MAKQVTMGFSFSLKATYDVCKEPSSKLFSVLDQKPFCGKAPDIAPMSVGPSKEFSLNKHKSFVAFHSSVGLVPVVYFELW